MTSANQQGKPPSAPLDMLREALAEAGDAAAWPDATSEDFRKGYRVALRIAIQIVTPQSDPSVGHDGGAI